MTAADKKEIKKMIGDAVKKVMAEIRTELQEATGRIYGRMVCTQCRIGAPLRYKDALAPSRGTCKECGGEMKWMKAE